MEDLGWAAVLWIPLAVWVIGAIINGKGKK
jgi:hypothetical protein